MSINKSALNPLLTSFASEQGPDESRGDVPRCLQVRVVHPREAVGVVRLGAEFGTHLPSVGVAGARGHRVVLFEPAGRPVWIKSPCSTTTTHTKGRRSSNIIQPWLLDGNFKQPHVAFWVNIRIRISSIAFCDSMPYSCWPKKGQDNCRYYL